ncbi:RidA family protein [Paraburkholderia phymatum]|uniref:Endoribonuclease L-PSP n=1 Tax=Paraburkholderia phymatum (strain DSM 17167 / CIP 108236 / LMG 21445 / STM815) TaxID=391038 RepID=B2JSH8_PARP8|nr:RidA family protein [Paraburkholderia phymatum]ACC73998.1 Endoribonuclease L-PSP [Paraburkholderia phymatum STM815]
MDMKSQTFNHGLTWEESYGYSQALVVGDVVYVSGQLSHDAEGNFVGAGDFERQITTTFENLDKILKQVGATRNQIVEDTVLVRNLHEHFDKVSAAHKRYFGEHRPASTTVGIVGLAFPDQLVEIKVTIRLDAHK